MSIAFIIIGAILIFNLVAFTGFCLSAIFHAGKDQPEDFV